jgi:hypothetical protein
MGKVMNRPLMGAKTYCCVLTGEIEDERKMRFM